MKSIQLNLDNFKSYKGPDLNHMRHVTGKDNLRNGIGKSLFSPLFAHERSEAEEAEMFALSRWVFSS